MHRCEVPSRFTNRVMIDGGYHKGLYTKAFRYRNTGFRTYAFDPIIRDNPRCRREAIWIYDGKVNLNIGRTDDASSILSVRGLTDTTITVPCIDFSKWLSINFSTRDYIHLKLDIEGAEYRVLDKMMKDGSIALISELVCEWHLRHFKIGDRRELVKIHDKLKTGLKTCRNITWLQDWF